MTILKTIFQFMAIVGMGGVVTVAIGLMFYAVLKFNDPAADILLILGLLGILGTIGWSILDDMEWD